MSYGVFAEFYDGLTRNVDYAKMAADLCAIFEKYGHDAGVTLDLACGTGSLAIELKKRGVDVFGADMSYEMLTQAQQKAARAELDIMFIRQRMQSLDLWGEIDTCVCTLDSLSHLQGRAELERAVQGVAKYLARGGLFVFDVNTPYKHEHILGNNTFVYDTDEVFLVWRNTFREKDCSVKIELDFFAPEGDKYVRESESFREFAYPLSVIEEILADAGLDVLEVCDGETLAAPDDTTQRLTIVSRKTKCSVTLLYTK